MASDIKKLYDLPDVSFIDNITADTVRNEMISDFQEMQYELTGEYELLTEFDKFRILINATTLKLYQGFQNIDRAGKMNLLKYSTGDFLINVGANRGVTINEEKAATCAIKFNLSQTQSSVISIPQGTRVTAGDGVYFETKEYCEVKAGETSVTTTAICQITGTLGNEYQIGQINILSDPIAYIQSVENVAISSGGEDIQSDEDFREKIFLAPSGYSTTGPEDAYIYWVNECSSQIDDVKVISPVDDTVQVILVKKDGELPDESFLNAIKTFLEDSNIKPMTEKVTVSAPEVVHYNIDLTYYINKSDANNVTNIHKKVQECINEYILWQKAKIARDVNPSYLQFLMMQAGVKRVNIIEPSFIDISNTAIAIQQGTMNVSFGGIEDD